MNFKTSVTRHQIVGKHTLVKERENIENLGIKGGHQVLVYGTSPTKVGDTNRATWES